MPAGLVVPVSGPFVGLWNAQALGTQGDDGFELSVNYRGQEINASDAYGMTLVEAIWRGQDWRIRLRGLEANKVGLLQLLQAFGGGDSGTAISPQLANIGNRWSLFSKTLLLTAILGNPPTTPQTLTALGANLAPNSQSSLLMTSKMREIPLEMVLLPYTATVSAATVAIPFSTT